MNCSYCDAELPAGAMFCGECGRAVAAEPAAKAAHARGNGHRRATAPGGSPAAVSDAGVGAGAPHPEPATEARAEAAKPELVDLVTTCEQCGAELGSDDIFCGECGYVTRSASRHFSRPRDTAIIQAAQLERDALSAAASLARETPREPEAQWGLDEQIDQMDDIEATRIVSHRRTGARFVLQFSTGESFTVYGTGLVGRNPQPEPAEYFDHIVRVLDPSRSVSKTHLEFGQEAGAFWVKDRFSGNGSIVREPEGDPVRCQPDRRYRVVRGTRVEMGEQFFIVS
ncbi:double zinc ribbon domain-containing protein [Parafrigoribacterium soli]|uniref:double zinc ribbon domain-containing protein n=1 Tax=Parafrigoribacterium soli TaxID=3144663 RepID=UPI0032EB652B